MSLYLDASAIVPLFVEERNSVAMQDLLVRTHEVPTVSDFGIGEVISAFSLLHRSGRLSPENVTTALGEFDEWRVTRLAFVEILTVDVRLATQFVRRFSLKLRLPAAIHLAVCQRVQLPLVTFDGVMAGAATVLGIELDLVSRI